MADPRRTFSNMALRIPLSENYPHFLSRAVCRPQKALRGLRAIRAMPTNIWIEITNRCNLRCRSCYKRYGLYDSSTDMDLDLFRRILGEVAPSAERLNLTGFGEFLYHKRIEEVFELLMRWPHIPIWFTTNGALMTEEWVRRLAGRSAEIIFSVDGTDEETHRFNRPQADFGQIVFALRLARDLELSSADPGTFPFRRHINFLVMRNNMHQMLAMVDVAKELGVTSLRFTLMNNWGCPDAFWDEQNPLNYRSELITCMDRVRSAAAEKGVLLIAPEITSDVCGDLTSHTTGDCGTPKSNQPTGFPRFFRPASATVQGFPRFEDRYCHRPFDSIYIGANGQASVCCAAWYITLGNARKRTIRQIWNGWRFRHLRAGMLIGSHTSYCRVCDLPYGLAGGNPRDSIIE
jgi:MoaA/NifB/PqqE/SkfB family radical SAM enzyme